MTDTNVEVLAARAKKKFDKLEQTCQERYQIREQRVISTLGFCMTALEQLQSWALFAIFPLDEANSSKYIGFVEQRFHCVIGPLRLFMQVLQKDEIQRGVPVIGQHIPRDRSPREHIRLSSTGSSQGSFSAGSLQSTFSSTMSSIMDSTSDNSEYSGQKLRDRISELTHCYIEEGQGVHKIVVQKLQKCRKDMGTVYRWGQASLLDLQEVFDEPLVDELYFLVRGKMARVLSTISNFDEAAEQIERNLSHHFHNQPREESLGIDSPLLAFDLPDKDSLGKERYEAVDLRLNLEDLEDDGHVPRLLSRDRERVSEVDDGGEEGSSTRGSTPEPPVSPRPKGLVKHPKIMKDKLQSYALPSKFEAMRYGRLGNSWS